jgi:hypothetical protein
MSKTKQTPADEASGLPHLTIEQEKQVAIEYLEFMLMDLEVEFDESENINEKVRLNNRIRLLEKAQRLVNNK